MAIIPFRAFLSYPDFQTFPELPCTAMITELQIHLRYSIVKDSNADFGVIFSIIQNWPNIKAVCIFSIIWYFRGKIKSHYFCYFGYVFNLKQPFLTKTINDYGPILEFQFLTVKSALLSLTIL